MTEAKNAETLNENHNQTPIGTLAHDGSKTRTGEQLETDIETRVNVEKSIIDAALLLLREYGVRKSGAALRDAVETPHDHLGPKEAVSAISNLGFKASFGSLKLKKLSEDFFPLISFCKDGKAVLVKSVTEDGVVTIFDNKTRKPLEQKLKEFESSYSGYAIIAKELSKSEKDQRSGHWFFSAFRKSKWIYFKS